jgi:hypothetical protein
MRGHRNGVLVLGVAVRKDCSSLYIDAFFFHQERYLATRLPIQLGLPTPPILSKPSADSGISESNLTATHLWALQLAKSLVSS